MADADEGCGMATDLDAQGTSRTGRAASRWTTVAVVLFAVGAWQVGIWINHWHIAERFYDAGVDATQLLRSGNQAMANGLLCFGLALLCRLISVLLRRRAHRQREGPVR